MLLRAPTMLLLVTLGMLGVACSTLPDAQYPPFAEHHVTAEFIVPPVGRLALPASNHCLVVHELKLDPAPLHEQFGANGERWGLYAPGTPVHMRCRFRAYALAGGVPKGPTEVLPGASNLRVFEQP